MTSLVTFILFLRFSVSTVLRVLLGHETLSLSLLRSTNPLPPQYPGSINLLPRVIRARSDQSQAMRSSLRSSVHTLHFGPSLDLALAFDPPSFHPEPLFENHAATVCDTNFARWRID